MKLGVKYSLDIKTGQREATLLRYMMLGIKSLLTVIKRQTNYRFSFKMSNYSYLLASQTVVETVLFHSVLKQISKLQEVVIFMYMLFYFSVQVIMCPKSFLSSVYLWVYVDTFTILPGYSI